MNQTGGNGRSSVTRLMAWTGAVLGPSAAAIYITVARPRQLRWGATDEEVARAMPGDGIVPRPVFNATRAVTIRARPEEIWPWIVQIGYGRAGSRAAQLSAYSQRKTRTAMNPATTA